MGCRLGVDSGSGGSVDTATVVAAVGAVAMLLFSLMGVLVMGVFVVEAVPGPQLTSNKILINRVKYSLIERNMLSSILEL